LPDITNQIIIHRLPLAGWLSACSGRPFFLASDAHENAAMHEGGIIWGISITVVNYLEQLPKVFSFSGDFYLRD
jgi:hypothetical protein